MEILTTPSKKQKVHNKLHKATTLHPAYVNKLSFYRIPPTEELTIEEFGAFAFDRLKVLKDIDSMRIRGVKGAEFDNRLKEVCRQFLPLDNVDDIRRDVISHFILRLCFCKPADRKWFLEQEGGLLHFRLRVSSGSMKEFLQNNQLEYSPISKEEVQNVMEELKEIYGINASQNFYKVPFEQAVSLVKKRKVLLKKGFAYVPEDSFSTIVTTRYRAHLSEALATAFKVSPNIAEEFDTIAPLMNHLGTQYLGGDYKADTTKRTGQVTIPQIDMLAKRSFPMCMKNLYQKLKENHHLKHMGRMQFGLFLKGIGLSMEDALTFWRSEFCQVMGVDQFDKNYAYNIRHNYGKEGKRSDYTPYSCLKIIMGGVGPGEHHGCPFRHFDKDHMKYTLSNQGVPQTGISELLQLVKDGHYQIACRKHFELTHPNAEKKDLVINHPNQYFDESERFYNGDAQTKKEEDKPQLPTLHVE